MVLEHDPFVRKSLVRRQPIVFRQLSRSEIALLIGEDEEDVVRRSGRLRRFAGLPALRSERRGASEHLGPMDAAVALTPMVFSAALRP